MGRARSMLRARRVGSPAVAGLDPRVGWGVGDDSGSRTVGEVGKSPVHQNAKFIAKSD